MIDRAVKRLIVGKQTPTYSHGVPAYHVVNDSVGRCGQPTLSGWCWLKDQGYTTIVKLNMQSEGDDSLAVAMGFSLHHFPITVWQQILWGPTEQTMHDAMQVLRSGVGKTICHCTAGHDRTGLVVMFLRIAEGWSWDDAFKECLKLGFHESLQGLYGYALRRKPVG